MEFINLPGIGGSGTDHWQTHWEIADARFSRFQPPDWDAPELDEWMCALDQAVHSAKAPAVLVAHSLACLLVAHWAARSPGSVRGAFLVSVPDSATDVFPAEAASFRDVPTSPLPFPALILASANDPYGSISHARTCASRWRAGLIEVGLLGHINAASRLGEWSQGRMLLTAFCSGLARQSRAGDGPT